MKFALIPSAGKIIVKEDSFKYTGNIIIPQKAERRPTTGKVVAVGRGVGYWKAVPPVDDNFQPEEFVPYYKVGDHLAYGLYAGTVLQIKGQPAYRVLNQDEILCIIESAEEIELEGVGMAQ